MSSISTWLTSVYSKTWVQWLSVLCIVVVAFHLLRKTVGDLTG
jgi:hypothetical protein